MCTYEFNKIETFLKRIWINHAYLLAQEDSRKKWQKHEKLEDAFLIKIQTIPDKTTYVKELATLKDVV